MRLIRVASAFLLGLGLVITGPPGPGHDDGNVSAQALNPCTLVTADEIEPLAANGTVANGVSSSPSVGFTSCRYMWGDGIKRFRLDVSVNEASRMFPGMSPEQIKQRLTESVRPGTDDAVIPEIGEAAVFRPDSHEYASATALIKGRILQVNLDGLAARERKDQVIGLLKAAASRL